MIRFIIFMFYIFISVINIQAKDTNTSSHTITIDGDSYFDKEVLYDVLSVKTQNILFFWKNNPPYIEDTLLPSLEATLKSFYDSEGFYDATFAIDTGLTNVHIDIDAKNPVMIKDINLSSDANISSLILCQKAKRFRAKDFVQTKSNIIEYLLNQGHCSYNLDTKAYVNLDAHSANLAYILKKGDFCTFGKPNIMGLKSIDKKIILSRVYTKEGERFDPKKVKETYNGIYKLNSFDGVKVNVDRKIYNVVPIDITLNEVENAYHFEGGVGYDTYIGPRIHASLIKKNFFGNAQQSGIKLSWSKKEQLAVGEYYKPALFSWGNYGVDFGTEFGYANLEYRGFQEKKEFIKLYLEHNEGLYKIRVGVALDKINIALSDNLKKNEVLTQAINAGDFLLFYPYLNFVYDARDDKLNPKYGYYFSSSFEYGVDYKPTASSYIKGLIEGRFIHTLNELTLATVAKVGVVDIFTNGLPESKLFFAGGSFYNRAYGFNTLGVIESSTSSSIAGASSLVNLSVEANYPIAGNLYGAIFNDNTMLNETSYDFTGDVISSVGLGVRYLTPIGPFKLDVGFNVNKPSQYGISFQIGQSF